jgi:hypothetical protein
VRFACTPSSTKVMILECFATLGLSSNFVMCGASFFGCLLLYLLFYPDNCYCTRALFLNRVS